MLRETLNAARDLGRLHEIASTLIRWGFGDVVKRLGMVPMLERAGKVLRWKDMRALSEQSTPERFCHALEELGPTFIKLGQLLSTRVDLFPDDWISAFERLQDKVPALPYEIIEPAMQAALGGKPEAVFKHIEKQAIAAASIAQVHRAKTHQDEDVAVKVRRPDIVESVNKDLRILQHFAQLAVNNIEEFRRFNPVQIVEQFGKSLRRELNLETECRYAEHIAENFQSDTTIVIPKVYWEWTSESLNVQQFIEGIRGTQLSQLDSMGYRRRDIALTGVNAVLKMIVHDGLFHADPHLGNIIVLSSHRIALIDFGMVGRLTDQRRNEVTDLLISLIKKNPQGVLDVVMKWNPESNIDETHLFGDIDEFLERYHGLDLKYIRFSQLLMDLVHTMRNNNLILPPDLTLLIKVFITLEGVGNRLDPDFNIVNEATPFITEVIRQRYRPDVLAKKSIHDVAAFVSNVNELPGEARDLLRSLKRGGLQINIDMTRLDHFGHQVDNAISRLTVGIVIAALIIGTAIVTATQPESTLLGLPVWGIVGFFAAALGGLWLLYSIWRGKRT